MIISREYDVYKLIIDMGNISIFFVFSLIRRLLTNNGWHYRSKLNCSNVFNRFCMDFFFVSFALRFVSIPWHELTRCFLDKIYTNLYFTIKTLYQTIGSPQIALWLHLLFRSIFSNIQTLSKYISKKKIKKSVNVDQLSEWYYFSDKVARRSDVNRKT